MAARARWAIAALAAIGWAGGAAADYDVRVELKNLSEQVKNDWPVILRAYTVLGRNLPPGSVNPDGFHVYDPSGAEVPHMLEKLPPYDQPGNDELVFVIPRIEPGKVLSYRVTNTAERSQKRAAIDVVGSPHNLIRNGGFEEPDGDRPAHFSAPAKRDATVKHGGRCALMLTADGQRLSARYAAPVPLHQGSWYYFGAWSKTDNVSRFGYQAGPAAHFEIPGFAPEDGSKRVGTRHGSVVSQCSTRDWVKTTFEYFGHTDWGMDIYAAQAIRGGETTVEFVLDQRKHYYMAAGRTRGTWWLDDVVFMPQPEVNVRFDLAAEALMKDGVFLFTRPASMFMGRLKDENNHNDPQEWCAFPYAHERLTKLDQFALKGQRLSFCLGLYHTRPIEQAAIRLAGGGLLGPGGAKLPVEVIEYCPGYVGPNRYRYMHLLNAEGPADPLQPKGERGVRYFFLTFRVPGDAAPGRYTGSVELTLANQHTIPLTLRVQDLTQPVLKDIYVGIIFQASSPRFDDEALEVYSRSGFTCLTRFGGFLNYKQDQAGKWQVDLEKLGETMMWLKKYGLSAVSVFSDFDLGPRWNGGYMLRRVRPAEFEQAGLAWGERLKLAEAAYKAQIQGIEAARREHPEWPAFIYMTWDEPSLRGGVNGKPDPAMAWVNQAAPDALTTLDVQFDPLAVCAKWYSMPAFDNPADWAGPELYRWVKAQGKDFGYCGQPASAEWSRYQGGMLMITSGARYMHGWHLQNANSQVAYDAKTKRLLRAISMIAWAQGLDDLKCHRLLATEIAGAANSADPRKRAAAASAEAYLRKVLAVFNGDHKYRWPIEPYLGLAANWGCDQFYDDWQEQMARHAAAIRGVQWIEPQK
ncbi:MAG: hypothetical protein AMK72_04615 [Planctomycetes bacterium SM23_25]|nr:MAG: hypothetical protein AMK72_04615 [Planctomycetes bacterium SM23_25]